MPTSSAILYKNADNSVFLIDIPTSIALAQELSPALTDTGNDSRYAASKSPSPSPSRSSRGNRTRATIFSLAPLKDPYVVSTEPKTDAARARVLERIPPAERVYHADVVGPLVMRGLDEIRERFANGDGEWCLPRRVLGEHSAGGDGDGDEGEGLVCSGGRGRGRETKRKRGQVHETILHEEVSTTGESTVTSMPIDSGNAENKDPDAPVILAPGVNVFPSLAEIRNLSVRNTSAEAATIQIARPPEVPAGDTPTTTTTTITSKTEPTPPIHASFLVPPLSNFTFCNIPLSQGYDDHHYSQKTPRCSNTPGLPTEKKFNLILLDPPWHNKSVRRSRQYRTQSYREDDGLTQGIAAMLSTHLRSNSPPVSEGGGGGKSLAAIWITNSSKTRAIAEEAMRIAGLRICEEWIWVKTTARGEAIAAVDGLWRKPYEILLIGVEDYKHGHGHGHGEEVKRRVIAAVPDVHSRKPNLKEVFEMVFFSGEEYSALEVFARNLTAGWWACGNEVLKFNEDVWWVDEE